MFDHAHYVPVLRWKPAERAALREMAPADKGDDYIWRIGSRQDMRTGNPSTWLRAGINHHLTFAARQIPATFTVPS
jgi:hypothetical protein